MFEKLFKSSNFKSKRRVKSVLQKHRSGPYAEERVRFLRHLEETGYSKFTLRVRAPALLDIACNTTLLSLKTVSKNELRRQIQSYVASGANRNRKEYRYSFLVNIVRQWLAFLSKLKSSESAKLEDVRDGFPILTQYLESRKYDGACAPASIINFKRIVADFLSWLKSNDRDLGKLTLPIVDEYLKLKGSTCGRRSIANYVSQLKSFLIYCEAKGCYEGSIAKFLQGPRIYSLEDNLDEISEAEVQKFLLGQGPRTITYNYKHTILSGLFKFALARGYCRSSPLPRSLPRARSNFTPYIYSTAEIKRLLVATETIKPNEYIEPDTFRVLILLLYGATLRISEALSLDLNDVDLEKGLLIIEESKFFKKRIVPVGTELREALAYYRCHHEQESDRPLGSAVPG